MLILPCTIILWTLYRVDEQTNNLLERILVLILIWPVFYDTISKGQNLAH